MAGAKPKLTPAQAKKQAQARMRERERKAKKRQKRLGKKAGLITQRARRINRATKD